MAVYELAAKTRSGVGKQYCKRLRRMSEIPCVVYGRSRGSISVQIPEQELRKALQTGAGENVIIQLNIAEDKESTEQTVIVRELQEHPVSGDILHVDFVGISLTEAVTVRVPVSVKGQAVGGVLEHVLWDVEVECLPTLIPDEIRIDVSELKIGDAIHVGDLALPEGVQAIEDAEAVVVMVEPPRIAEVEVPPEEAEAEEPEVIREKKEEEEEGEAG
jgi:large subunit ribosomal protein L25